MVTTAERDSVPYAPTGNVVGVINRSRERGVPNPLTIQELERIGIPSGNAPRTLVALKFLGLLNPDGSHTPEFDRLRHAPTEAYPDVLAEILRAAYHGVFAIVNPAEDSDLTISDAFRGFQPEGQRDKMISLFMGLCKAAGIGSAAASDSKPRAPKAASTPKTIKPKKVKKAIEEDDEEPKDGIDYRLLSVLMQRLPRNGKWTSVERSKWLGAVTANVDVIIEVVD